MGLRKKWLRSLVSCECSPGAESSPLTHTGPAHPIPGRSPQHSFARSGSPQYFSRAEVLKCDSQSPEGLWGVFRSFARSSHLHNSTKVLFAFFTEWCRNSWWITPLAPQREWKCGLCALAPLGFKTGLITARLFRKGSTSHIKDLASIL